MRAWQIHEFGGTEQLRLSSSVKLPKLLGPKDVLIAVHASSVNPVDIQMLGKPHPNSYLLIMPMVVLV